MAFNETVASGSSEVRPPHGLKRLLGRDPAEEHRAATPLELLYDLTLVVAFSIAGSQFAHALAADHLVTGLLAFAFCMFAIIWAWISSTWTASAYDSDDWGCRVAMLVQMLGVTILALGIGDLFHGFEQGELDNQVIVVGYVIMRLALVATLVRAARGDPDHRRSLLTYGRMLVVAQIGWLITGFVHLPMGLLLPMMVALYTLELGGVWYVERRAGSLPWNPHHTAERFALLGIITFGEVVLGTTTAVEAVVTESGWSLDAAVLAFSGITMVVGMWWVYFTLPHGEILERRRGYGVGWALSHLLIYSAIAATGAGLHAVAYFLEHHSELGALGTTLTVAIPLGLYVVTLYAVFHLMLPGNDPLHLALVGLTLACIAAAVALVISGVSIAWPVLVLTLAPWISVLGYELGGHAEMRRRVATL